MSFDSWKQATNAALYRMLGRPHDEVYAELRRLAAEHRLTVDRQTDEMLRQLAHQCESGTLAKLS